MILSDSIRFFEICNFTDLFTSLNIYIYIYIILILISYLDHTKYIDIILYKIIITISWSSIGLLHI